VSGIVSYGVYIPYYRLDRNLMRKAWWFPSSMPGKKAIANYDEDALTMASESVSDALKRVAGRIDVDGLFFATTSSFLPEKQGASSIAAIVDFPEEIAGIDFSGSLRAGISALKCALDAVGTGTNNSVVVTAADCRLGHPGSDEELIFGDGSSAFIIGKDRVIARPLGYFSVSDDFTDFLRKGGEKCTRRMDDLRFINTFGYKKSMERCILGVLKKCGFEAREIKKLICPSHEPAALVGLTRKLGFDAKSQLQEPFFDRIGHIGVAHPLLMLAASLDEANEGDKILVAAYGDGAEAFIFEVTPEIEGVRNRGKIKRVISSGKSFENYQRYLYTRNLLEKEVRALRPFTSPALNKREEKQNVRRYGSKCRACGFIQYPMRRICLACGKKDEMDDYKISEKGTIFTYTREYYIPFTPMKPPLAMVVADMEGGGRLHIQMTDHEFDEVKIGAPVRLTYRRLFEAGDTINYFWKCKPIRDGEE